MDLKDCTQETVDVLGVIRMSVNAPGGDKRVFCVVEGDDDVNLYSKYFVPTVIVQQVGAGCEALIELIPALERLTKNYFCIKDSDFDKIIPVSYSGNVFLTDYHDLETTIIAHESCFSDVCCEHGRRSGYAELIGLALDLATDLGYIRLFNHENKAQINFKGLGVSAFYDGNKAFDLEECIKNLNARSSHKCLFLMRSHIEQIRLKYPAVDRLHLCCGHDVCKLLAEILKKKCSLKKAVSFTDLQKALRLSFTIERFKDTQLYRDILVWSQANYLVVFAA